ncbi:hypothetical protein D3C76_1526180 [compost metagenome]
MWHACGESGQLFQLHTVQHEYGALRAALTAGSAHQSLDAFLAIKAFFKVK